MTNEYENLLNITKGYKQIELDIDDFSPIITEVQACIFTHFKDKWLMPRISTDYELVFFSQEDGAFILDGEKYPIHSGSIRLIKPGQAVTSYITGECYVLHFKFNKNHTSGVKYKNEYLDAIPCLFMSRNIQKYISVLHELSNSYIKNSLSPVLLKSYALKLIDDIHSEVINCSKIRNFTKNKLKLVSETEKYIENNFSRSFTLQEIAKHISYNANYIVRTFKEINGITPMQYAANIRINEAKKLLLSTDISISDISGLCGFYDSTYFTYVFKKSTGHTPTSFRKIYSVDL